MIYIKDIIKRKKKDSCRLCANIIIDEAALNKWILFSQEARNNNDFTYMTENYLNEVREISELWFEIPFADENVFVDDRSDAFLVAMLFFAMATGEDIKCQSPVSSELLFNLNHFLLPSLANISDMKCIKILADSIEPLKNTMGMVGTGMSCGVDSLQSLYEFSQENIQKEFRLTHLTYLNVGADRWYLKPEQMREAKEQSLKIINDIRVKKIKIAKDIADQKDLGFIYINSNISDFYQGCFEESHIYRSCSAILAVQNYFSTYYLSSTGCPLNDYQPKLRIDPGHYEQLLLPCLSTGSLRFLNSGKPYTRLNKIKQIQDDPIAQQYLNVCSEEIPCYHCRKDFRTIIAMEILECGYKFPVFFDVDRVKKVRWQAYFWLLRAKGDIVAQELISPAKRKKLIPAKSYIAYIVWSILHFVHLK